MTSSTDPRPRQRTPAAARRPGLVTRYLDTSAPEALFALSAIAQYTGTAIAALLFDEVAPQTVAWLRVTGAAIVLLLVSRHPFRGWTRSQFGAAALFGTITALMNTFFYLGLARTDLGTSVAIEFIGPIIVAAAMTRTGRNAAAVGLAAVGVLVLGGLEVGDNTTGLLWILAASAMWAAYIVLGSHVARLDRGVSGLAVGLSVGAVVLLPIGAPGSANVLTAPRLLFACLAVGVCSNAIGYGIDQHVLRRIPVRRFSLLLALLPVSAVAFGWLVLGQRPSSVEAIGIGLVLVGVIIQERDELPRDPMLEPS